MQTVYIETSIISYLRQRPSAQVVMAARQLLTHQWWDVERGNYELVTSQYVVDEAAAGDPALAQERLESLDGIPYCRSILKSKLSAMKSSRGRSCLPKRLSMHSISPWWLIIG